MSDAFTGDAPNEHGPSEDVQAAADAIVEQQAPPPPPAADESPDVSEQIAAIRSQQDQILERLPNEEEEQANTRLYDLLYGDAPVHPGQQHLQQQAGQPQMTPEQYQQQEQQLVQAQQQQQQMQQQNPEDPRVLELTKQLETLREAVVGREEADNQRQLDALAAEHKDFLADRRNAEAVRDTVYSIAQDDELLRTDPALVRTAILATKASAAATAAPDATANGGAPIETAAGAAVADGGADVEDIWKEAFKTGKGNDPFTT